MKLLTVGQSLQEGKTVLGKYKLTQQNLPKFASTVRHSSSTPAVETVPEKLRTAVVKVAPVAATEITKPICSAQPEMPIPTETAPSALEKTQKIPAGKTLRRVEEACSTRTEISFANRMGQKIAAFKKKLFPVRSKKKPGAAPVQTEWALEKIRVARNDLSEADLVVVAPKRTAPIQKTKPSRVDSGEAKNPARKWTKMTARLFKTSSPFAKSGTAESDAPAQSKVAKRSELVGQI